MIRSKSEKLSLPKLNDTELNTKIKSELTIEKLKDNQKNSDYTSEFTTVSTLVSYKNTKKLSISQFRSNFGHRLCFNNYIPLRFYNNQTLLSNWFEDRLRIEDKIKKISQSSLVKSNLTNDGKIDSNCFYLRIEIEYKTFCLTVQFPYFYDSKSIRTINLTLKDKETSELTLRFFRVKNGRIEDDDPKPINYSENICILTCDRKYCMTSGNDFLDREKTTGLLNIYFVSLLHDRINDHSIWTIEPYQSKNDHRILLEKFNTPVDLNDLVLIRNSFTNRYACIVLKDLKPQIVLDRLYPRINQNINWKIEIFQN